MEMTRKAMASGLLLWLLLVHSDLAPSAVGWDDCWVVDPANYLVCTKTAKCRSTCQDHGFVDGRCKWGFPDLVPVCKCLRPHCPP
ncbi:hypothetical protein ACP70R_039787 [Stipagrostis hirtigluma subsp. patula]